MYRQVLSIYSNFSYRLLFIKQIEEKLIPTIRKYGDYTLSEGRQYRDDWDLLNLLDLFFVAIYKNSLKYRPHSDLWSDRSLLPPYRDI